jgi:hypothetical protein
METDTTPMPIGCPSNFTIRKIKIGTKDSERHPNNLQSMMFGDGDGTDNTDRDEMISR